MMLSKQSTIIEENKKNKYSQQDQDFNQNKAVRLEEKYTNSPSAMQD